MTCLSQQVTRVLAIEPTTKGFGFAVLEGSERLVDWGTKDARHDKGRTSLRKMAELCEWYLPDLIVVEDYDAAGSRRWPRVRGLIRSIRQAASRRKIPVRMVAGASAKRAFARAGMRNKHQVATAIAGLFPELGPHVPPPRRLWMTEDDRMSMFEAIALALTAAGRLELRKQAA